MVLIVGAVVTIVYCLLGAYVVRLYGLGVSSEILTNPYKPGFAFFVPIAIILTNLCLVGVLYPAKVLSMSFLYINAIPAMVLTFYLISVYRLTQIKIHHREEDQRARAQINAWISHVTSVATDVTVKPYVYLAHHKLRGKVIVVYKHNTDVDYLKSTKESLPQGVTLELVHKP